jgi:hypothetical protein
VNCTANGLAGLGSAEARTREGVRRVAIHLVAETIKARRARGHAQRFVDASEGRAMADVERDMVQAAKKLAGGRPSLLLERAIRGGQ